jgi:hypothetical protein
LVDITGYFSNLDEMAKHRKLPPRHQGTKKTKRIACAVLGVLVTWWQMN